MRFIRKIAIILFSLSALLCAAEGAAADQIAPLESEIFSIKGPRGGVFFKGNFELDLSNEVFNVLRRGIALTFIIEVEIEKKRWYWVDKKIADAKERIRLSFNPLTRQYRVSIGNMNQSFETLEQAIYLLRVISNLKVSNYRKIDGEDYEARARFFLDTSRLPKPFQVTLKKDDDWNLDTGWFDVPIGAEEN